MVLGDNRFSTLPAGTDLLKHSGPDRMPTTHAKIAAEVSEFRQISPLVPQHKAFCDAIPREINFYITDIISILDLFGSAMRNGTHTADPIEQCQGLKSIAAIRFFVENL